MYRGVQRYFCAKESRCCSVGHLALTASSISSSLMVFLRMTFGGGVEATWLFPQRVGLLFVAAESLSVLGGSSRCSFPTVRSKTA